MKSFICHMGKKVRQGKDINYVEAINLINISTENTTEYKLLLEEANQIKTKFMGKKVDLCSILNIRSGKCSEDCKFCAQSAHHATGVGEYDFLDYDTVLSHAREIKNAGVHRFSLVSSGRGLSIKDTDTVTQIYTRLHKDCNLKLCASHGIINYEQALALKKSGVFRYHHNLETSRDYYNNICTTHTFEDRINTIKIAQQAGLDVCCGGIIGLGESQEDRVKMAFEIKNLAINSVPINVLNPIQGTPLGQHKLLTPAEILKTIAVFRFILPIAVIRFAGGRKALNDSQGSGFLSGANGAIVGNYLTTVGNDIAADTLMIKNLDLEI